MIKRNKTGKFVKTRFDRKCLDCGKNLSGYKSKRCSVCAVVERMKKCPMPKHIDKHSKNTKKKISDSRKGKGLWFGKKRNLPQGKNHHNWLGGKTGIAEKIRKSDRYKKWRGSILIRDDYTCQDCGKRGGKLEVHHKVEFVSLLFINKIILLKDAYKCKALWNKTNAETLCVKCHNLKKYGRRKKNKC